MIDWLDKLWYLKLFDVALIIGAFYVVGFMIHSFIKSMKNIGANPTISTDGYGRFSMTLIDSNGNEKEVTMDEFTKILKEKDLQIEKLILRVEELTTKVQHLEEVIKEREIIENYKKQIVVPFTQHTVFFNLNRIRNGSTKLQSVKDTDIMNLKREVANIFLEQCKVPIFYERLYDFVKDVELQKTHQDSMSRLYSIMSDIHSWIREYTEKAGSLKITLSNGKTLKGVPDIFITKFNEWHDTHVEMVTKKIQNVLYNEFYSTWQLKLIVILDHIDTAFYLTILDAEKTLLNINGEFEKELVE